MAGPGWHPDPGGTADMRYWDGTQWTVWVFDGQAIARGLHGVEGPVPPVPMPPPPMAPPLVIPLPTHLKSGWPRYEPADPIDLDKAIARLVDLLHLRRPLAACGRVLLRFFRWFWGWAGKPISFLVQTAIVLFFLFYVMPWIVHGLIYGDGSPDD